MSIDKAGVIDHVAFSEKEQKAVLIISDHLDWEDENEHIRLFEQKISSYLTFIRSGQILESLPEAENLPIRIELVQQYKPTDNAVHLLNSAKQQLAEMGLEFTYHPLPTGYRRPS